MNGSERDRGLRERLRGRWSAIALGLGLSLLMIAALLPDGDLLLPDAKTATSPPALIRHQAALVGTGRLRGAIRLWGVLYRAHNGQPHRAWVALRLGMGGYTTPDFRL